MFLYLRHNLVKASPEPKVTKLPSSGPEHSNIPPLLMRLKPTKVGSPDRKTGRLSRDYAGTTEGRSPYRCNPKNGGCGKNVIPASTSKHDTIEEAAKIAGKTGGEIGNTTKDGSILVHRPHRVVEGAKSTPLKNPVEVKHHPKTGGSGLCPDCHDKWGGFDKPHVISRTVSKSIELLSQMLKGFGPAGEGFGKPMEKRKGESSNEFMSRTIRHLMKDKGYDQKRAVAAAYQMTGQSKTGKPVAKSLYLAL